MTPQAFTRQELYDLIWPAPMRSIAADLSPSDVGLRKAAAARPAAVPAPKALTLTSEPQAEVE